MTTPGWYGKLPSLGDFASRRLPEEFLAEWDEWLQRSVAQSREHLGEKWLDTYLTSNIWRFLIAPGALLPGCWGGILVPSVDRVGRYYPLTICAELGSLKNVNVEDLDAWFSSLETASSIGLDANSNIDQFDLALQSYLLFPENELQSSLASTLTESLLNQASFTHFESQAVKTGALIHALRGTLFDAHFAGHSLWTCANANTGLGGFICKGMPSPSMYARMLEYTPGLTS